MRTARLISFICAAACLHSCTTVTNSATEITIDVEFGGVANCTTQGIDSIEVSSSNGEFSTRTVPCTPTVDPIVEISSIPAGTYTVQLQAMQANGQVSYSGTSNITAGVSGVEVTMDLTYTANFVTVDFVFGAPSVTTPPQPSMTCFEAGVNSVSVSVDSGGAMVLPCHDPDSARDAAIIYALAGTHTFAWQAFASTDGSGTALYSVTNTAVPVQGQNMTEFTANFAGLVNGGFEVTWQFDVSATDTMGSCSDAMVANVVVNVDGPSGSPISGSPFTVPCTGADGGTAGAGFAIPDSPGLTPGVYNVTSVQGQDSSGAVTYEIDNTTVDVPANEVHPVPVILALK